MSPGVILKFIESKSSSNKNDQFKLESNNTNTVERTKKQQRDDNKKYKFNQNIDFKLPDNRR